MFKETEPRPDPDATDGDGQGDDTRHSPDPPAPSGDPPGAGEDESPAADRPGERARADHELSTQVTNNFYAEVHAQNSTFGCGLGGVAGGSRRLQGTLRDVDVRNAVANYVRPPGFDDALRWLRRDRVVVIEGCPGSGRRAGAIALLSKVTKRLPIMLSPTVTLHDLADRKYREGEGYLVVDRTGEDTAADVEVGWANVVDRVKATAGAFLVVTTSATTNRSAAQAVQHVAWERPATATVLRAHLLGGGYGGDDLDAVVEQLTAALPPDCPLGRLVGTSELVSAGAPLAEALEQMERESGRHVTGWFSKRTRREIAEVTALAFQAGATERRFESRLARLEQLIEQYMPGEAPARTATDQFVGGRGWVDRDGLIGTHVPSTAGSPRVVVFKEAAYQRFVVARLWDTCEVWFWNAVRDWIDEIVREGASLEVASGLAWLSCVSLEEVQTSFLGPWSRGALGWNGQVTASYLLWCMCREESTVALALQTAIRWANAAEISTRSSAMLAFTGELGVYYPHEAVRRLWQLLSQRHDLREAGCAALGILFAVLVDQTQDAGVVLAMLDERRRRFAGTKPEMRRVTMAAVLETVMIRHVRTGRPAIFEFLHAQPDRLDVVARLWGALICHRPLRRRALVALWHGLYALREVSDDPCAEAAALGLALAHALPANERGYFTNDFARLDRQLRQRRNDSPVDVLAACLNAISKTIVEERDNDRVPDHSTQDAGSNAEARPAGIGQAATWD